MTEQSSSGSNGQKNETTDFIKMFEMLGVINGFANSNANNSLSEKENQNNYTPIEFDEKIQTKNMKAVKAAIPYLDPVVSKKVGMLIKLIELQNLMKSDTVFNSVAVGNVSDEQKKDMLIAIRPHLEINAQQMIDMILKMFEIKKVMLLFQKIK